MILCTRGPSDSEVKELGMGPIKEVGIRGREAEGRWTVASNEVWVIGLKYVMSCDKWKAYYSIGCQISVTQSPHLKRSSTESVRNCNHFFWSGKSLAGYAAQQSCKILIVYSTVQVGSKPCYYGCHNFPNSCSTKWFDFILPEVARFAEHTV